MNDVLGVCSKYTSFVALDSEGEKGTNENWVMQTRYVPSQFAYGWHGGRGGSLMMGAPMCGMQGQARMASMPMSTGPQILMRSVSISVSSF